MALSDLETEYDAEDDEYEEQCIHGKWDSESCDICDNDPELQAADADIIEDDDEDEGLDDDAEAAAVPTNPE